MTKPTTARLIQSGDRRLVKLILKEIFPESKERKDGNNP